MSMSICPPDHLCPLMVVNKLLITTQQQIFPNPQSANQHQLPRLLPLAWPPAPQVHLNQSWPPFYPQRSPPCGKEPAQNQRGQPPLNFINLISLLGIFKPGHRLIWISLLSYPYQSSLARPHIRRR